MAKDTKVGREVHHPDAAERLGARPRPACAYSLFFQSIQDETVRSSTRAFIIVVASVLATGCVITTSPRGPEVVVSEEILSTEKDGSALLCFGQITSYNTFYYRLKVVNCGQQVIGVEVGRNFGGRIETATYHVPYRPAGILIPKGAENQISVRQIVAPYTCRSANCPVDEPSSVKISSRIYGGDRIWSVENNSGSSVHLDIDWFHEGSSRPFANSSDVMDVLDPEWTINVTRLSDTFVLNSAYKNPVK